MINKINNLKLYAEKCGYSIRINNNKSVVCHCQHGKSQTILFENIDKASEYFLNKIIEKEGI